MVGPQELVIVLVVILGILLITRGPAMLPRIGEALGRTVKTARTEIPSALRDEPETRGGEEASEEVRRPDGPDTHSRS